MALLSMNQPQGMEIGGKLALLAKLRGLSQGRLAERINVSRVSINRFFKGKSSIRTCDLVELLKVLDIDLENLVDESLGEKLGSVDQSGDQVFEDMVSVMQGLDQKVQHTVLEQVVWWGRCVSSENVRKATERLHSKICKSAIAG